MQVRGTMGAVHGSGSGIAIHAGQILTNAHVIVTSRPWVETPEGHSEQARVVKQDRCRDLALLAIEQLALPAASFASRPALPGQPVIAVGNPLGFVGAVSTGFIHQTGAVRGLGSSRWIQSDVRLAPGNSGGPLANIHGEIIGVNTMIAGPVSFAIPVGAVQAFLSSGAPRSLGVTVRPVWLRSDGRPRRFGLILLQVDSGSPAQRASLLAGDVLVGAADKPLASPDDLHEAISNAEILTLVFLRAGSSRERQVTVQLAPAPEANVA